MWEVVIFSQSVEEWGMLFLEIQNTRVTIRARFILLAKNEKEKWEKETLLLIAVM